MRASLQFHRAHFKMTAIAAISVSAVWAAVPAHAAGVCPLFIAKYCVYDRSKRIFTASTNPCLAKLRHWTVIYMGACRFGH